MSENNQPSFKWLWSVLMIFIYFSVAFLLVFTPIFDHVPLAGRIGIGVLFFIYGIFRAYRVWKTF